MYRIFRLDSYRKKPNENRLFHEANQAKSSFLIESELSKLERWCSKQNESFFMPKHTSFSGYSRPIEIITDFKFGSIKIRFVKKLMHCPGRRALRIKRSSMLKAKEYKIVFENNASDKQVPLSFSLKTIKKRKLKRRTWTFLIRLKFY